MNTMYSVTAMAVASLDSEAFPAEQKAQGSASTEPKGGRKAHPLSSAIAEPHCSSSLMSRQTQQNDRLSPRTSGTGIDTRSRLVPAPKHDTVRERAHVKLTLQRQTDSYVSRFCPGEILSNYATRKVSSAPQMPDLLVFYSWWNEGTLLPPMLQRPG